MHLNRNNVIKRKFQNDVYISNDIASEYHVLCTFLEHYLDSADWPALKRRNLLGFPINGCQVKVFQNNPKLVPTFDTATVHQ